MAFGWVHRAAVILRNKKGLDTAGVRRRYRGLIAAIARHRRAAGRLAAVAASLDRAGAKGGCRRS